MKLKINQALQRAVAAHKNGRLQEAEHFYRAILKSQANHPGKLHDSYIMALVYNNLGFISQHRGDLKAAIDSYKQAAKVKPDYHEAYNNLGYTLQLEGDLKSAIDNYKQAVKVKPDYIDAYYNMGHALQEKGDLKAAVSCYRRIVEIEPDNADAFNALGAALQLEGDLEAAIGSYKQAVKISPAYVEAYNNIGSALQAKGDLDAAIDSCKRALAIKPDYANAHNNMGHALYDKGDLQAAIDCYKSAIKLMPDSAEAYNNLGNALKAAGKHEEAVKYFDVLDGPKFNKAPGADPSKSQFWLNAKSQALECLYVLGRFSELEERLNELAKAGDINRRTAAISAFVTHQLNLEDPHTFCKQPLDVLHVGHLDDHISDSSSFLDELILEGKKEHQVWEPKHGVTKLGFHTSNTIFKASKKYEALEKILRKEISSYYSRFKSEECAYMNLWPREFSLKGWFSRLVKNGHQRSHIHPAGWLSGVVYLKTIDALDSDEGSIEFGLHGYDLPILDDNYTRKVHRPKRGEIVLFPSSLFHRTIPFNLDTERCVIAFDLLPAAH